VTAPAGATATADGQLYILRGLPLQGPGSSAVVCDHEGVPRGTAARGTTRYRVRLTVPRRGGWGAWDPSAAASSVLWPIRPALPSLRPRSPPSTAGVPTTCG
jgi:hypothetical protein